MVLVFLVTLVSGIYPYAKKIRSTKSFSFPLGESFAAGVFLGAGLIHMLGDASHSFYSQGYTYPLAFLIAGSVFLFFSLVEHLGHDIYAREGARHNEFAILAAVMLSLHSFFAGTALGLSASFSVFFVVLLAILAHKWAASFALAVQLNKADLPIAASLALFSVFSVMAPLGIFLGESVLCKYGECRLLEPVFSSIASGTFLYLGTLHGLGQAILVRKCDGLHRHLVVVAGFSVMAIVAIWN